MISCSVKNELIMDLSGVVNHPCSIIFTPWNKGIKWSGTNDGVTDEYDRLENPGIPFSMIVEAPGASPWQERIPAGLMPRLLDFEELFPDLIFAAMWYLSRYPSAIDLLMNQPLQLFALIMRNAKNKNWGEQTIVELFSAQKSQILAACDSHKAMTDVNPFKKLSAKQFRRNGFSLLQQNQEWAYPGMCGESQVIGIPAAEAAA